MHGVQLLRLFVFLLWRGFLPGALPPWRRPSGRARFFLGGGGLRAGIGPRLQREGGVGRGAETVGLPHPPGPLPHGGALPAPKPTCTRAPASVGGTRGVPVYAKPRV